MYVKAGCALHTLRSIHTFATTKFTWVVHTSYLEGSIIFFIDDLLCRSCERTQVILWRLCLVNGGPSMIIICYHFEKYQVSLGRVP